MPHQSQIARISKHFLLISVSYCGPHFEQQCPKIYLAAESLDHTSSTYAENFFSKSLIL